MQHNTHDPKTRAPTIGVATPTQDEPRNATRNDAEKPTPSVATPTKESMYEKQMSLGMPYDTTLSNRR
jgi:hypothetical protein